MTATVSIQLSSLPFWQKVIWFFRKKQYQIAMPESWMDLSEKQREKVLRILMRRESFSMSTLRVLIFHAVVVLPAWLLGRVGAIDMTEKLLPATDWLLASSIDKPFAPAVNIAGQSWMIPSPMARSFTITTYFAVEKEWSALAQGDDEALPVWLATLLVEATKENKRHYRKTGLFPTRPHLTIQQATQKMTKVTDIQAFYLVQYYNNIRQSLKKRYPHFFDQSGADNTTPDWAAIPAMIADAGLFGSLLEVNQTPGNDYLAYANKQMRDQKKEKEKELQNIIQQHHQKFLA